jgi:hypothetical protein
MTTRSVRWFAFLAACVALLTPSRAPAGLIFQGSSGSLAASADFELSGNTVTITLTNTSAADVLAPTDVLTGLFFNTAHALTPVSASLNGSTFYDGSIIHNVGEGWQYAFFLSGGPQGKDSGLSAAGLGLFGPTGNLYVPPANQSNPKLGGIDYGITSAGDNPLTGNGGITRHGPLIKDSIKFTLTAGTGFSLLELGQTVVFQYGTSLSEAHISATGSPPPGGSPNLSPPAVPEPSSVVIWLAGIAGLAIRRKLR